MSLNDFDVIRKLGEGAFSSVFKVRRISDGQDYAMKNIKMGNLNTKEKENAVNEIRFLASISSPEIIGYKEAFYDEKTGILHIIMEYCAGGDLLHKIKTLKKKNQYLDERVVWLYIIQMIRGLKCLHDLNILHRDFKCANLMLTRDHKNIKLGDLNVSKVAKQGLLYTQTGTPYYASPEVWKDKPYNSKSDVWSLGCVIYELVTLNPPFKAQDMDGLFKKVQKGEYDPIPSWYSQDLSDLISLCLQVNTKIRKTTSELFETTFIQSRLNIAQELNVKEYNPNYELKQELLKTLRIGKNLNILNNILPEPQYISSTKSTSNLNSLLNDQASKNMKISSQTEQVKVSSNNNSQYQSEIQKQNDQPIQKYSIKKQYSPYLAHKKGNYPYSNYNAYSQQNLPSQSNIPSLNHIQSEMNLDAYEQKHEQQNKNDRSRSIENLLLKKHPMSTKMSQQNQNIGNYRYQQQKDSIPSLPPINQNKPNLIKSAQDNILSGRNYNKLNDLSYNQKSNHLLTPVGSQKNIGTISTNSGTNSSNTSLKQKVGSDVLLFAGKKLI